MANRLSELGSVECARAADFLAFVLLVRNDQLPVGGDVVQDGNRWKCVPGMSLSLEPFHQSRL